MSRRPSVAKHQAERQEAIERIYKQDFWKSGDEFRASDVAQHLNRDVKWCHSVLTELVDGGKLTRIRVGQSCGGTTFIYRRVNTSALPFDWRVNIDIYELIDQLERGW